MTAKHASKRVTKTDLLLFGALDDVVSASILIGSYEVWIVDSRQRDQLLHIWCQLSLQVIVQYLCITGFLVQGGDLRNTVNESRV